MGGTHSNQDLVPHKPRAEQLITVEYTFRLMSHTIPQFVLHTFNAEKLKVKLLSQKILAEAFVFPKMNTKPILNKLKKRMKLEILVDAVMNSDILTALRLFKK